ncbi:uncharacterized protein LOC141610618 [Silene latifolia]|uniref:uncharacterized protein LOC141610618 n=1 Tax=Silene latifolia TaxID=37657 RepID=UPI003D773D3F
MVVKTLGPGRFYGGSLPRPFIYSDVKYSEERIDPPVSVNNPLLSWANEAHWSMGGMSFDRTRLMGKIEGNVEKLRKQKEKENPKIETPIAKFKGKGLKGGKSIRKREIDSPPPAPKSRKLRLRSRVVDVENEDADEDEDEDEEAAVVEAGRKRRRLVRKLGDEFELVADDKVKAKVKGKGKGEEVSKRRMTMTMTRRRNMILMDDGEESDVEKEVVTVMETRSSPRLKN